MRKLLFTFSALLLLAVSVTAQAPAFFNYQGVARNSVGNVLANQNIRLRLTIREGNALGITLFSETRTVTTNAFGLFSVQVGGGGAISSTGSLSAIPWQLGTKWLQVEIDINGGTSFKDIGTTQLSSVPMALYANQSTDVVLPFVKSQNEESPLFRITNTGNNASSLGFEGISASGANNAAAIRGILSSATPGINAAAVTGQVNATAANGIGVMGSHGGNGWGVYGTAPGGVGVYGNSQTGTGVWGQSTHGASVYGLQPGNGTGNAGLFRNTGANNGAAALSVQTNGTGEGLSVVTTGSGMGATVAVNNPVNGSTVLDVFTNGPGKAGSFRNSLPANTNNVLEAITSGAGRSGFFQNLNAASNAPNFTVLSNGNGDAFQSIMTGTGKAAVIGINNTANSNMALDVGSNGSNNVINSISTGTGRAGFFQVSNAASTADALSAVTNGTGASWAIRGTSTGSNGAGLFIQSNTTNTANNLQSNQAGLGRAAFFNATNTANTANALEVNMAGTGFAASFSSSNAVPRALRTSGAIQFTGLGEGANKVLATVDGSGTATWQNAASVGLVSGSGTNNYIPRWTPSGTVLGNSLIQDNGLNIGIAGNIDAAYKVNLTGTFRVNGAVDNGAIALFENTSSDVNSDGIVIKLGRTHTRWTGSAYVNLPNPSTQGVETQVNQIRDWIYGNDTFSWDDLINLMPSQYIVGTMCNITNYITQNINTAVGLPRGTPSVDVGYQVLNALNNFADALIDDDWVTDIQGDIVIPAFQFPAIPQLNCNGLPTLSFPVLAFDDVNNSLKKTNEFVSFVDKDNRKLGAIRAQSIQDFSYDYFDGQKLLDLAAEFIGIDLVDDFMSIVSGISEMVTDYNNIGVEYSSGNGDYAEWLERIDPNEEISFGDIVAVRGGKITKNLKDAQQIMAVSKLPIVLGNVPDAAKAGLGNNIAFMGQIPVKVTGPVESGDYIVAKGEIPGYGIAIHPRDMKVEDFKLVVGRSWDTHKKEGPKMVNTVVGVHNHDFLNIISALQQRAENTDNRLKAIEAALNLSADKHSVTPKKGFK